MLRQYDLISHYQDFYEVNYLYTSIHMGKKIYPFKVEPESAPLQIQDEIDYKSEQDQLSEQESLGGAEFMSSGAQNNVDPMELEGPFTCQMHQALVLNIVCLRLFKLS